MKRTRLSSALASTLLLTCLVAWVPAKSVALNGSSHEAKSSNSLNRDRLTRQRVRELMAQGMAAYRRGDIETAAARWREVLLVDPNNRQATIYLKEIGPELTRVEAKNRRQEAASEAEARAARKLDEKVTVEVKQGTRLRDFLETLSFVSGLNFVIAQGADLEISAKFENQPVREILDSVLTPNGLTWTRKGDIITVAPNLRTRVFSVDSNTFLKLQRLYDSNELQRVLWNATAPPLGTINLALDDRQSAVILTDSPANIEKMRSLIAELGHAPTPKLATRIYSVRSDLADNVKVLVEALLHAESEPAYAANRRVLIARHGDNTDLIVRDTEDNLRKVEDLLKDRGFIGHLEEGELEVYTTNLTPRDVLTANPEQVEAFGRDVKEVIETMLYHKDGIAAARKEGRRLWYDPTTLQLTITDYPSNIRKVAEFIEALPQLEPKQRSKILFLEYANAADMVSQLNQILGITGAGAAGTAAAANQAAFSLRVQDERTFRDLSVRLVRVDENNFADDNDDSCELVVRTSTAQSSDLSIPEYRSEVFENYEIYVDEVEPSPTPGEGRVRIQVRYLPQQGGGYY